MKTYYKTYTLILVILLIGVSKITAQVLDPIDFGFEDTSIADWTQVAGFIEETSIVASGLKSMKADMTYPVSSPKLQTYRNAATSNGTFQLSAGNYTVSVMVYLTGDVPTGLKISPTSTPIFSNFSFEGVAKNQWVKLELPFTVAPEEARNDAWLVIQFLGLPSSGSGTVYIDDITIIGEVVEKVPPITKIETLSNAYLNLTAGNYTISMNVWLDPSATITRFYTHIETPWTTLKWDLEGIAKGEWVRLNQDFTIENSASNAKFLIQASNNLEYGGGIGTFYIDDIEINLKSLSTTESKLKSFNMYPNPATNSLTIETQQVSDLKIYSIQGVLVKHQKGLKSNTTINLSNLSSGMYLVKLSSKGKYAIKKLIIR